MSKDFTSEASQTDWERIDSMQDHEIDYSEIPEITEAQMQRSILRVAGKVVDKETVKVPIDLEPEVIAYFKMRAGDGDYQKLINETLKESIRAQNLEETLRRIIREELRASAP